MVVVSHDREFLDQVGLCGSIIPSSCHCDVITLSIALSCQLCTKTVETERGVATTYPGNYTQFINAKSEKVALQWAAWERQQKEISKQQDIIARLAGGAQSGRAAQAEKALERIKEEGLIEKPFIPKKRSFTFPHVEKMGQKVLTVEDLTHGYPTRPLFENVNLAVEKGDRVAIIGPNGAGKR